MAHPAAICNPRIPRPLGLLPDYDTGVHFPRPKGMLCSGKDKAQTPDLDDLHEWAQGNPMVRGGSQSWETIEARTLKDELWICTPCPQELGIDPEYLSFQLGYLSILEDSKLEYTSDGFTVA